MEANTEQMVIDQLKAIDSGKPYVPPPTPAEPTPTATPTPEVVPAEPIEPPVATAQEPPPAPPVQPSSGAELELAQLKAKLTDYEAKANLSPFASDLVKEINQLVSTGASANEISRFIEIQSLDVTSLDDASAIKTAWKLENPALNDREIEAMYRKEYEASEDDEDESILASAKRKTAALGARAKLNERKVNSVPEGARQAQLEQARVEQAKAAWGPVVNTIGQSVDFSATVDDSEVPFKYAVPETVLAGYRQEAAEWAASNKIPLNEQGVAQVNKFIELKLWAEKGDEIKQAIVRNAYQAAAKAVKAQEAGAPVGSPSIEPQPPKGPEDVINQLKAMDRETFRT